MYKLVNLTDKPVPIRIPLEKELSRERARKYFDKKLGGIAAKISIQKYQDAMNTEIPPQGSFDVPESIGPYLDLYKTEKDPKIPRPIKGYVEQYATLEKKGLVKIEKRRGRPPGMREASLPEKTGIKAPTKNKKTKE